jgi:hypothetical protein
MQARTLRIHLIWLAMGASLLVPLLLFSLASWISYRHIVVNRPPSGRSAISRRNPVFSFNLSGAFRGATG